ncbi:MAG: 50S ribosomal protein L11 methyltransferase [Reyranellaceae bacterium]
MSVWKLEVTVPERARAAFELALQEALGEETPVASTEIREGIDWRVEAYIEGFPNRDLLAKVVAAVAQAVRIPAPAVTLTELEDKDWVAENQRSFLPFSVGRFFIYPSFHHGGVPKGQTGILIDPGMAFGTGTHPTTRGCLMAIDEIGREGRPDSTIDLGCGSGILAIALAAVARRRVLACDNDPVAVRVTEENARLNRVDARVIAVQAEGLDHDVIRRRAPFDLVVANILAQPLIELAPAVAQALAAGGRVVLSGLLNRQAEAVSDAYRAQGLTSVKRLEIGDWTTLVLKR